MNTQKKLMLVAACLILLAVGSAPRWSGSAQALPPKPPDAASATVPYAGKLNDAAGNPVADGTYDLTFSLYDAALEGVPLWTELQQGVAVQGGAFQVLLGSASPLPPALQPGQAWLAVAVRGPGESGFTTLNPRQDWSAIQPGANPEAASSCAHTHFTEFWKNGTMQSPKVYAGLSIENDASGKVAFEGISLSGFAVQGITTAGVGVYGATYSTGTGTGVRGESDEGIGVQGRTDNGIDILADGTGVVKSVADSVLVLSPHAIIERGAPYHKTITPLENGSTQIRGIDEYNGDQYVSIPLQVYGSLFGTSFYVKSLQVCFSTGLGSGLHATAVTKESAGSAVHYIYEHADPMRFSSNRSCFTLNATTPLKKIDGASWVQFNVNFDHSAPLHDPTVIIYAVNLTVTQNP